MLQRKSASWSGPDEEEEDDQSFQTFGTSLYKDGAKQSKPRLNSISMLESRSKVTDLKVVYRKLKYYSVLQQTLEMF